jgi:hypothetical protein
MDKSIVRSVMLCLAVAGCGGGSDSIPECDAALAEIESACSEDGLSDVATKTCLSAKKSVKTLADTGLKTGKIEIAADGCRKQADGIEKITKSKAPAAKTDASAKSASAAPSPASGGEQCGKLQQEVEEACGSQSGLSAAGKAICSGSKKVADTFAKMASKKADVAEQGCEKTRADWAKKGGLKQMVGV